MHIGFFTGDWKDVICRVTLRRGFRRHASPGNGNFDAERLLLVASEAAIGHSTVTQRDCVSPFTDILHLYLQIYFSHQDLIEIKNRI